MESFIFSLLTSLWKLTLCYLLMSIMLTFLIIVIHQLMAKENFSSWLHLHQNKNNFKSHIVLENFTTRDGKCSNECCKIDSSKVWWHNTIARLFEFSYLCFNAQTFLTAHLCVATFCYKIASDVVTFEKYYSK